MSIMSDLDGKKNVEVVYNRNHFTAAAVSIMDILKEKSSVLMLAHGTKTRRYEKLHETCTEMLNQYRSDKNNLDESKIIKKVYKTLRDNIGLLKSKDSKLFRIRDEQNKVVTILPGVDIGLGYVELNDVEKTQFWQHIYLMFVSSVKMIYHANQNILMNDSNNDLLAAFVDIEKELTKTGITIKSAAYNPYMGLSTPSYNTLNVDELFSSDPITSDNSGMGIDAVLNTLGISSKVDMSKINEELKNITEDEIKEAVNKITGLIGANADSDVGEVCNDLVRGIVDNMKENGISDMMGIIRSATNVTNKINPAKMKKTAMTMNSFMQDSTSKLRTMKDEHGNMIGEKLFSAMENPLKMVKDIQSGKLVLPGINNGESGTPSKSK